MTAKKIPSKTNLSRNRSTKAMRELMSSFATHGAHTPAQGIEDAIEQERARLMKAEAILHCAAIAIDATGDDETQAPYFEAAISVARDLISRSIDCLDSVRIRPMLEKPRQQDEEGIREGAPKYLLQ